MYFLANDESHLPMLETALGFHDIGLWLDKNLAYLEPGEEEALRVNSDQHLGLDPEVLRAVIHWHHKVTAYNGKEADVVNAARKAGTDSSQYKIYGPLRGATLLR